MTKKDYPTGERMKTHSLLIERYHTNCEWRDDGTDPAVQQTLFKSFARTVGSKLPEDKNASILDVGCGEGSFLLYVKNMGYSNLAGFDLSPQNVEICRQRGLDFVRCHNALDVANFPKPKEGWEYIFCFDLLEHLPKDSAGRFLLDIKSVLIENGTLIIQTPNMSFICAQHHRYNDMTHEIGFTDISIYQLFKATGFSSIEIFPVWNATTVLGRLREIYLLLLHKMIYLVEGKLAPKIATKNLMVKARKE